MGMLGYVLTIGLLPCFRKYAETDVDGQLEEILDAMEDNQEYDGNVNVGSTMANIFATKAREKREKDFALRLGERLLGWKLRSNKDNQLRKRMDTALL